MRIDPQDLNMYDYDMCVCDLVPKPQGVYWRCSSSKCKYANLNPHKLEADFNGDFINYFNGTTGSTNN